MTDEPTATAPPPRRAPVRGSRTGRPVMALLDLLGRRGTLRILWELRGGAALSFRALRTQCDGMSPSVLNDRLKELRAARLLEGGEGGYALTDAGTRLLKQLKPLHRFAEDWAAETAVKGENGL